MFISKKIFNLKKSVFYSFLISYVLVFIIPILAGILIYSEVSKTIQNEIDNTNSGLMNQVSQAVDNVLKDVEKISIELSLNDMFKGIVQWNGILEDHHRYTINQIINNFRLLNVANGNIDNFYVYLKNHKKVIGPLSFADEDIFYKTKYEGTEISYDEWEEMVHATHIKSFRILPQRNAEGRVMRSVVFFQSVRLITIPQP